MSEQIVFVVYNEVLMESIKTNMYPLRKLCQMQFGHNLELKNLNVCGSR